MEGKGGQGRTARVDEGRTGTNAGVIVPRLAYNVDMALVLPSM